MKNCAHCGKEFPDNFWFCPDDGVALPASEGEHPPSSPPADRPALRQPSASEQHFWERVTLRQFGVVMIRLQAVWMLFEAAVSAIILARSWYRTYGFSGYSPLSPSIAFELFFSALRIIATIAAAIFAIQQSERILSWLVKDLVAKQPPGVAEKEAA